MKTNQLIRTLFLFGVGIVLFSCQSEVEVTLPKIINSNMVLQRDQEVKIWGWGSEMGKVTVTFNGQKKSAKVDEDSTWMVTFNAMEAGGPYEMLIMGKDTTLLDNVLIGDVWVCSGQSNMEWKLENTNNAEEEIANANYPMIRLFDIPHNIQLSPVDDIPSGEWMICTPENIPGFSSVGYLFGRNIHEEIDVPIGLISTNWGGTNVETWMSSEMCASDPELKEKVEAIEGFDMEEIKKQKQEEMKQLKESLGAVEAGKIDGKAIRATKDLDISPVISIRPNDIPTLLYNGMINPIINYSILGVIWYQGEANAKNAFQYRTRFPNMISDWRNKWDNQDMGFYFVQLANFRKANPNPGSSTWAELREAQTMTLSLHKTGMAVIIDIGEADNIHPRNKQDVGLRLAFAALHDTYGKDVVYSGPVYKSMAVEGAEVTVEFDHLGSGLMISDEDGIVKGFAIAGEDQQYYWADGKVVDNKVILSSDLVENPVAIRYAWADNPDTANLYNKEGLPAGPFRTDEWKGITE